MLYARRTGGDNHPPSNACRGWKFAGLFTIQSQRNMHNLTKWTQSQVWFAQAVYNGRPSYRAALHSSPSSERCLLGSVAHASLVYTGNSPLPRTFPSVKKWVNSAKHRRDHNLERFQRRMVLILVWVRTIAIQSDSSCQ